MPNTRPGCEDFDFDMIVGMFGQSLSPGNEQRDFWGSAAADQPGSRNMIGIKDPVVDDADRQDHHRPRPRGADRRLPGAGSGAALELLRDPAMVQPGDPDRLLGQAAASGDLAALRRRPVRLVGRPGNAAQKIEQARRSLRRARELSNSNGARLRPPPAAARGAHAVRHHAGQFRRSSRPPRAGRCRR